MTTQQPTGARNFAWCRVIVARLVSLHITHAVVCPGSRSAAMVLALQEGGLSRIFVQTDERSAAFFALGVVKRTGRPVIICSTSGSAVANVLAALAEADAVGLPLVLLSCDRPAGLRGKGLPQTTEQVAICAPLVRASLDLGDPADNEAALRRLDTRVAAAAVHLLPGPDSGPIQINVPLLGNFSSIEGLQAHRLPPSPALSLSPLAPPLPARPALDELAVLGLRPGMRGAIVCGPDWDMALSPELLRRLADRTGLPVIADAPGSARGLGIVGLIAEGDLLALHPALSQSLEFLIRIGSAPVSHTMQSFVAGAHRIIRIDRKPLTGDFLAASFCDLSRPTSATVDALAAAVGRAPPESRRHWSQVAGEVRTRIAPAIDAGPWSELQVTAEALKQTGFGLLHVANSLAIRLVNLLLPATQDKRLIYANRGVSGIDGTIGSFLGELAMHDGPGLLLIGDLAAIHDVSALETCLHEPLRGAILVMNNGGAALFDLLPLQEVPEYSRLVRNSISISFEGIAASFGMTYRRCAARAPLREALHDALAGDRLMLIETTLPPDGAKKTLPGFFAKVLGT